MSASLRSFSWLALVVALGCAPAEPSQPPHRDSIESTPNTEAPSPSADTVVIVGRVRNANTEASIAGAVIVLRCTCFDGTRERLTNERGFYWFDELPPGSYTIQVLAGNANTSKTTLVPAGRTFVGHFAIDPDAPPFRMY
jgi:hypothetical protein